MERIANSMDDHIETNTAELRKEYAAIQRARYTRALDDFTDRVKSDPNVIALLLSGSLSYGTVWEKSDIDLTMIVRDGSTKEQLDYCVDADGIEMHVLIMESAAFKQKMQKARGGMGLQNYFGLGEMVYSKDESLTEFFNDARKIGKDDAVITFIMHASFLILGMTRAEKWITVFDDAMYSQRFLQNCAIIAADMELLLNGEVPSRESVLRAMELNPALMRDVYVIPGTTAMTKCDVRRTLKVLDDYLMRHISYWGKPILKYLSDGEVKRVSEIMKHFGVSDGFPITMSYLASKGFVERVALPSRVFRRSGLTVDEVAYIYLHN